MITLNYLEIEAHQRTGERLREAEQQRLVNQVMRCRQPLPIWQRVVGWKRSSLSLSPIIYFIREVVNER